MYRYETHLHTAPVSACAKASVRETIEFYASEGYDGVFLTNHFLDGNIGIAEDRPYKEKLDFYFSAYYEAKELGEKLGLQVFPAVELTCKGTDFLVYGPEPAFYYAHPEILDMKKTVQLPYFMEQGALVVQAHPFREAYYIDHIRLFPRSVHGFETLNADRTELENRMADIAAEQYGLLKFAGSDNHWAGNAKKLAGMESDERITSLEDFIAAVKQGKMRIFTWENRKKEGK